MSKSENEKMKIWEEATKLKKEEVMLIILYMLNVILDITTAITTKNAAWIICGLLWGVVAIMKYYNSKNENANKVLIELQEQCIKSQESIINALMSETAVEVEISKIKIPKNFSKPNQKKMQNKIQYYRKNHKFESQIVIDLDYNLLDGYTSYLIAKNYNKTTVIAKLKRKTKEEQN